MKFIKFLIVGFIAFAGVNAIAQQEETVQSEEQQTKETPEKKGHEKFVKLAEELELNEEQKAKAKEIRDKFVVKRQEIKADTTLAEDARKTQFKELRKEQKEEFKAILNETQLKKLETIEAERKAQKMANRKTPGEKAEAVTQKMIEELELTDEQAEKVRTLNLKVANKIKAIKDDPNMTPEKKKEFIQGNKDDHHRMMKTILTEEQMVKYEAMLEAKKQERKEHKKSNEVQPDKVTE